MTDWAACDNEAQEEIRYAIGNYMDVRREVMAKARERGLAAVVAMMQLNIDTGRAALMVLEDLADGSSVAAPTAEVEPSVAWRRELTALTEERDAARKLCAERHNEVLLSAKHRDDGYSDGYGDGYSDGDGEFKRERDDERRDRAKVVIRLTAERDEALESLRVTEAARLRFAESFHEAIRERDEARRVITDRDEEIRDLGESLDKATRDLVKMVFSEHEMRKERDAAAGAERPGSWGAGKGPTSEAKDTFVAEMAKPAEVKPSCHGCAYGESNDPFGSAVEFCAEDRELGRTIAMAPGAACPCWCPLLEVNQ